MAGVSTGISLLPVQSSSNITLWHDFNLGSSTYPNAFNTAQYVQSVSGYQANSFRINSSLDYYHRYTPSSYAAGSFAFSYLSSNRPVVTNSFSVCGWVRMSGGMSLGINTDYFSILDIDSDISIRISPSEFGLAANSSIRVQTTLPSTHTWYFFTITFENTSSNNYTAKIYINNSLAATSSSFTYSYALNRILSFSGHEFTVNQSATAPDCLIDSLGVYNKILSASEMTYLYNAGSGRTYLDTLL